MIFEKEIKEFKIDGKVKSIEPYGEGHINSTYLVVTTTKKYILQKINTTLFDNVEKLMKNIELVTNQIEKKLIENKENDIERKVLKIVKTYDDKNYFQNNENNFFRVYVFIDNANAFQIVEKSEHFYESAIAFGTFQKYLSDFDASQLYEVIPNFHNTRVRFENFKKAIKEDKRCRALLAPREINFFLKREKYCDRLLNLIKSKEIPLKVTHNDTKLNNVMIDSMSGKALAVIDLDTVMAGTMCYDFGDSIRFGCNSGAEDEKDLSKVYFRLDLFEIYAKGYLKVQKNSISKGELKNLAFSAILLTYECGMRFLTDYLQGDTYFKIERDDHNLDRARTQMKLVSDMENLLTDMEKIIKSI